MASGIATIDGRLCAARRGVACALVSCAGLLAAMPASAATRYVASSRSLARVAATARPGTVVIIRPGTYAGFAIRRSGRRGHPIVFRAGGAVTIVGAGGKAGGVPAGIALDGVHDVAIEGFTVRGVGGTYSAGIGVNGGARIVVRGDVVVGNQAFGVHFADTKAFKLLGSRLLHNGTGVQVDRAATGLISRNQIGVNDHMIVNDSQPGNDRGANGIVFYKTTGGIRVVANRIWGNRARSHDYGWDGGAFEIYAASGVTMSRNTLVNNANALETGTDGGDCNANRFLSNSVRGRPSRRSAGLSQGLILRCSRNMKVVGNTLVGLDTFAFYVDRNGGAFAGSIAGLQMRRNRVIALHK
jgi:hypothetical protein